MRSTAFLQSRVFLLVLVCISVAPSFALGDQLIELEGRVACLDANDRILTAADCPGAHHFGIVLKGNSKLQPFSPADVMTEMFKDERVRQMDLRVSAKQSVQGGLELTQIRAIKEGRLHDIYYFCEVCNIKTYAPGPCPCCRNELDLHVVPAAEQAVTGDKHERG
jgi:hypothetical protein